jgi:hypothetical protein
MANAGAGECRACHSEHRGRDSDIVQLDPARFDHRQSDFALEGAHRTLVCTSCHKAGEAWGKAPAACGSCHKTDDIHQGQMGQNCAIAMATTGRGIRPRQDRFRLGGAHG